MTGDAARLAAAEAEAARARERFGTTITALQERIEPHRLADEARRGLLDAGRRASQEARAAVLRRPDLVAGAAAVGALFLARRRIARLLGLGDGATASDDAS